jgi:DUF2911 family protein
MLLPLLALLGTTAPAPAADSLACRTMNTDHLPLATRASPLDSISFTVGSASVKVCFGRPSARGRVIFGGLVPYGTLWRTGANEPTMIHTTGPIAVAGVALAPGSYSLYSVPAAGDWDMILNRSITQWGHESTYTPAVKAQEVGHGTAKTETLTDPVEQLRFRVEPTTGSAAELILEWATTRVRIPLAGT